MSEKPTLIFVAGAWHTPFHLQPLIPHLNKLGYNVIPLQLRTSGITEPRGTFQDNIDMIRDVLETEIKAEREVYLLGHSAGGMPSLCAINDFLASNFSEEKKSRLLRVIFLASFTNLRRALGKSMHWQHWDEEKQIVTPLNPAHVFYNDLTPEEAQPYVEALVPVVKAARPETIDMTWQKHVHGTYILCTRDHAIPPAMQRVEAEDNGMEVVEFESDHSPFLSHPEEFAIFLDKILQKMSSKI